MSAISLSRLKRRFLKGAPANPINRKVYSVMTVFGSIIATEDQVRVVTFGDVSVAMEPG